MIPEEIDIRIDVSRMDLIQAEMLMRGLTRILASAGIPSKCTFRMWNEEKEVLP